MDIKDTIILETADIEALGSPRMRREYPLDSAHEVIARAERELGVSDADESELPASASRNDLLARKQRAGQFVPALRQMVVQLSPLVADERAEALSSGAAAFLARQA